MKRFIFILFLVLSSIFVFSQRANQKVVYYKYSNIEEYDDNANLINGFEKTGMIVFYEISDLDFVSIIVGNEIRYFGKILTRKEDYINPNRITKTYLVNMEVMKENIPLQIFEIYDKTISEYIPSKIIVTTYNSKTYQPISSNLFSGITLGLNSHWKRLCENQTYEYVDLGLSVKWATCNIGGVAPEDYGDYFAWAEIEEKLKYDWSTYKYSNFSKLLKYSTSGMHGDNNFIDDKTILEFTDDVAFNNWGCNWSIPSYEEFNELKTKCQWLWTTKNGISGYKIIGPNGNSIFLPAAGSKRENNLNGGGEFGFYWTNSLVSSSPHSAFYLFFSLKNIILPDDYRCYGFSIRPVCP